MRADEKWKVVLQNIFENIKLDFVVFLINVRASVKVTFNATSKVIR